MVIGRRGFFPAEGAAAQPAAEAAVVRLPLVRDGRPILRNYCAFWKRDHAGCYAEAFAQLLRAQFE